MTQPNELINKHIDSIKFNGCQLSKEMLTLMFDGVVALAKLQESFEINQRYLESIGTAFGNGANDQPDPHKGFIVGEVYKHRNGHLAYYCGINKDDVQVFEFIDFIAAEHISLPKGWTSKGNDTCYAHDTIHTSFNRTPIVMPDTIGQHITEPESISEVTEHPNKY